MSDIDAVFGQGGRFELTRLFTSPEITLGRTAGGVFVMCFEAPEGINAENRWTIPFSINIHEAFEALEENVASDPKGTPAALLTVSRSPKFFSNGIDPAAMRKASKEDMAVWNDLTMPAFGRPLMLKMPTVCAINGHAYGAGIMHALGHDYRLMRNDKGFICAIEVAIGLNTPSPGELLLRGLLLVLFVLLLLCGTMHN